MHMKISVFKLIVTQKSNQHQHLKIQLTSVSEGRNNDLTKQNCCGRMKEAIGILCETEHYDKVLAQLCLERRKTAPHYEADGSKNSVCVRCSALGLQGYGEFSCNNYPYYFPHTGGLPFIWIKRILLV